MEIARVHKTTSNVEGTIHLEGSKSISNRVLIIQSLCKDQFTIENLSPGDDTNILQKFLHQSPEEVYDAGHAGTSYRFTTAYLSMQEGTQILTGSERMKERPIGPLVDALRSIGASIDYIENEGYPPLKIGTLQKEKYQREVSISGAMSSQYLSALLLIAPTLPEGLKLHITDKLVSRPYLEMTLRIMSHFGVAHEWVDDMTIDIQAQSYQAKDIFIESDWSAASYFYEIAAFADEAKIELTGLFNDSLQGDRAIANFATKLGIDTSFGERSITITKSKRPLPEVFEYNFLKVPDLAQSIAVLSAGIGVYSIFSGLETLKIKETDRIAALKTELEKVDVFLSLLPAKFYPNSTDEYYAVNGKANKEKAPQFETYRDHRMAMAFAPLASLFPITIEKPMVVTKSYASYWDDLQSLGFDVKFEEI